MFLCLVVITYEKLVLYVQVSDNTTRKTVNGVAEVMYSKYFPFSLLRSSVVGNRNMIVPMTKYEVRHSPSI
jgi:hypothetical protein